MSLGINSTYENEQKVWNVGISGELDLSCSEELKTKLDSNIEENLSDINIDMSKLKYIDSTGVGVIVGVMKNLRSKGKDIKILNARDNVKKIFNITGLDQIIKMEG